MLLLIEGFIDAKIRSKAGARSAGVARAGLLLLTAAVLCLAAAAPSPAAETPDELYRKGRFSEAEKAYAGMDMDHPKDLRYRYNRGCAAYQGGDYQAAASAFSSVLRRTEDNLMRFKAAYNLGNAAYKQGDFQTAAQNYKQALALDPSNPDARYNLELALREMKKQKDRQEKQSGGQQQQEKSEADKKQEDQSPQSENKFGEDKPASDRQKESDAAETNKKEKMAAENDQDKQARADQPSKPAEQKDLSGELKPRDGTRAGEANQQAAPAGMSVMDRKKAEALLDNIQEDRSLLMRLQTSKEKRQGTASGKDW
jgi:Ca-activated chloride channel family protein